MGIYAMGKSQITLKSQIFPEKYLNHLAKSQITIFSSSPKSLKSNLKSFMKIKV